MASIKITLDDQTYEIDPDKLTLGEARILKRDFGMATLGQLNFGDPDQMVGILAIAIKRANPGLADADVVSKVEALDFVSVIEGMDSTENGADPTPAPARRKAGKPATTPASSGSPA